MTKIYDPLYLRKGREGQGCLTGLIELHWAGMNSAFMLIVQLMCQIHAVNMTQMTRWTTGRLKLCDEVGAYVN